MRFYQTRYVSSRADSLLAGIFSGNEKVPANGSRDEHLLADGTLAGFQLFGVMIGAVFGVAMLTWLLIWLIFRSSKRQYKRKGLPTNR